MFARYGIDRPQYLSNFDFAVSRGRDGKATIKVTSNRSVTEPYVTLLVEAAWARGRLVREYTVLLDPAGVHAFAGNARAGHDAAVRDHGGRSHRTSSDAGAGARSAPGRYAAA